MQAFERQVDSLSRQLSQGEADGEDLVRQREALLEEIRAAQQVLKGAWAGEESGRAGRKCRRRILIQLAWRWWRTVYWVPALGWCL